MYGMLMQIKFKSLRELAVLRFSLFLFITAGSAAAQPAGREVLSLNQNWRFFRIDAPQDSIAVNGDSVNGDSLDLNDQNWEKVNLPHTVRLEPIDASGGRNFQGVCWYTRRFKALGDWKNRVLYLRFEGAMSVADVWLNGTKLTTHYNGYQPFTIEISKSVRFDVENVLAVRLDNSDNAEVPPGKPQNQLDFAYFGGLYRDVDLIVLDKLHVTDEILANKVAGGGIFVSYPTVTDAWAAVRVQTDVLNEYGDATAATVAQQLCDKDGRVVASGSAVLQLAPGASATDVQQLKVNRPKLWHPDHPNLYTLVTTIGRDGRTTDTVRTRIGIREIQFTVEDGLLINGKRFLSIGANRHQDHAYVGYAVPASDQWRDAKLLGGAGFTSCRSHYPQDRAFLDACDEMGILVIESNPGWQTGGDDAFTQRVLQNAREMIRRDRNRPSVILWEAQLNESGGYDNHMYGALEKLVHEEYPFQGCYTAGDSVEGSAGGQDWDVVYDGFKGDKPRWQREWGDTVDNWGDQQSANRVARGWGEVPMLVQAERHAELFNELLSKAQAGNGPALAGVDLWAGMDAYRGYHHQPFLGGVFDLLRLPKFDAYFFESQRSPTVHVAGLDDGPMVFIANYATFQSPSQVSVFSNCEQVRLLRNGNVVATKRPVTNMRGLSHPPFVFDVGQISGEQSTMFMTGVAKPGVQVGELKAEGLIGGRVVATTTVRAPGKPTQLILEADLKGKNVVADGSDWVRVYARVCDSRGTTFPYGNDQVTFAVDGAGELISDPHADNNPVRAEAGIATALVRASMTPGDIKVTAQAFGLSNAQITITSEAPARNFLP
jgi:beta-galactosidase